MTQQEAGAKLERVYDALLEAESDHQLQRADWLANWEARNAVARLLFKHKRYRYSSRVGHDRRMSLGEMAARRKLGQDPGHSNVGVERRGNEERRGIETDGCAARDAQHQIDLERGAGCFERGEADAT